MPFPGPSALGRGLVCLPGSRVPAEFDKCERILIDDGVVDSPVRAVNRLHKAWLNREPIVIELAADPVRIRRPAIEQREPYELDARFEFPLDRLQFLLWANNYDARTGEPIWWWARKAEKAFGERVTADDSVGDITIDGQAVWCDGGPRQTLAPSALRNVALLHRDSIELGRVSFARDRRPQSELAEDQFKAVTHGAGPARIIAPAGSGKTRVLTERLRYLVADRGWESSAICALAYNKRAADEMAERTASMSVNIRTLNSLGLAICNGTGGFAPPAGRRRRNVIEEVQVRQILDGLVELQRAPNTDPYVPYLEGLRAIRLALIEPEEAEEIYDAPGLADVFPLFTKTLDERDLIDFDGQLYEAIRILLTDPAARTRAHAVARYLLVDEFQDLTPAHLLLIRLMASPTFDVFGVGDDDQVIYGFGGATPEFLLHFDRYFPGAAHHALEVNYRCPPEVIDAAKLLLSYNDERIKKEIRPAPERKAVKGELSVNSTVDVQATAGALALIQTWNQEGVEFNDMALLSRVNATLLPVQITLTQAGIPCRAPLTESILDRTGTRTALAYMRIALNPDHISRKDVVEVIRRPGRRIARNVVEMVTKKAHTSIADIRRVADYLSGGDAHKMVCFAADLDLVVMRAKEGNTAKLLRSIRVDVGLGEAMDVLDGSRREADRSTHQDDLIALEQVAALHPDPATFEKWLRQALRNRPAQGGVELSTIHRVKGREWQRVIVYGVEEGLMPHRLATDESEERRLLHVAITRCRERCVVLCNRDEPSFFLDELNGSRSHDIKPIAKPPTPAPAKKTDERRSVGAEVGLVIRLSAGYEGEIVEVRADGALVAVDGVKMTVRFGEVVRIGSRSVVLTAPNIVESLKPQQQELYDALAAWRREVSTRDNVPAYVVLSNEDVRTLAVAAPKDLKALAACKGMGPKRLERYGDEILSVVDTV